MPVDYQQYHPKWTLIRRLVFKRAGDRCENCFLSNYSVINRKEKNRRISAIEWDMIHSAIRYSGHSMTTALKKFGFTKIVLTIAHIDQDVNNNHFTNLRALCQKCHLKHDRKQHQENRRYGKNWKKKQLKLEI